MKLLSLFIFLISSVSFAKEIPLKWKAVKGAHQYQLQISPDQEFSQMVVNKKLKANNLNYNLKSGIYFLRVQAMDQKGKPGRWSKPFKLVVTAPIKPLNKDSLAENLDYGDVPPPVLAQWSAPEKAPKYLVKVFKDDKEFKSEETDSPRSDFIPKEPGEYRVEVRAGLDKYYGPAVTVKKIKIAKAEVKIMLPPEQPHYSNSKPTYLAWTKIPGIKTYKLTLYKVDPRSPASAPVPVATQISTTPNADFGKLPPGKYVAAVSTPQAANAAAPLSEYTFKVRREKPVEFERVDLSFKYNIREVDYQAYINEAGKYSYTRSWGGELSFQGTMWFPNSSFGLRGVGNWGKIQVEDNLMGLNDIQFFGTYRKMLNFINTRLDLFAGARAWTMPFFVKNINPTSIIILDPTLFGPSYGFTFTKPLGPRWSLMLDMQFSHPMAFNNVMSIPLLQTPNFSTNSKVRLGAKYALNNISNIVATIGEQSDELSYVAASSSQGGAANGQQTNVRMNGFVGTLGFEMSEQTAEFNESPNSVERFSDLDFSLKYNLSNINYSAKLAETSNSLLTSNNSPGGTFGFKTDGYFFGSAHGFKLAADWSGFNYGGSTISFPEFSAHWAWKSNLAKKPKWVFKNYFGIRSWALPVLSSNGSGGNVFFFNPELLGPNEGVDFVYRFTDKWSVKVSADISVPLSVSNKVTAMDKLFVNSMSYRASLDITNEINEDLNVSLNLGYKLDQYRYSVTGGNDNATSTATLESPLYGLSATYSF